MIAYVLIVILTGIIGHGVLRTTNDKTVTVIAIVLSAIAIAKVIERSPFHYSNQQAPIQAPTPPHQPPRKPSPSTPPPDAILIIDAQK